MEGAKPGVMKAPSRVILILSQRHLHLSRPSMENFMLSISSREGLSALKP